MHLSNKALEECAPLKVAEVEESRLLGFYQPEVYENIPFRWSQPQAAIVITTDPEDYKLELELLRVRPLSDDLRLTVYFDEKPLPLREISPTRIQCDLPKSFFGNGRSIHKLLFSCNDLPDDLKDSSESRSLGIPLISIALTPLELKPDAEISHLELQVITQS